MGLEIVIDDDMRLYSHESLQSLGRVPKSGAGPHVKDEPTMGREEVKGLEIRGFIF